MSQVEKLPESKYIIRFPDCDPFNHLNNARYLDYFINAREDHLLKFYNFNIYKYAKETGLSWVVAENQIAYLRPAMLMEIVVIQTTLLLISDKEVKVEMRMWNETKTVLKALLWTTFVHFNLTTQKSEIHSGQLKETFKPLENPLPDEISFEQRVEMVRGRSSAEII